MKVLLFFACMIHFLQAFSQPEKLTYLSKLPTTLIDSIHIRKNDTLVYIKFEFGEATLLDIDKISVLENRTIVKIDLVYTTYVESPSFNQFKLNFERFKNLLNAAPFLIEQDYIAWRVLGSTAWKTDEDAKKLFSGFIFHVRPKSTKKETDKEIEFLKRRLHPKLASYSKGKSHSYFFKKKTWVTKSKSLKALRCYSYNKLTNSYNINSNITTLFEKIKRKPKYKGGESSFYNYITRKAVFKPSKKLIPNKYSIGIYSFDMDAFGKMSNIYVKGGNNHPNLDTLIVQTLRTMPKWSNGNTNGLILKYNFIVIFTRKKVQINSIGYNKNLNASMLSLCDIIDTATFKKPEELEYKMTTIRYEVYDSYMDTTVTCIFKRNLQWKNMLVVADLTGSMSPYTEQLLVWFKLGFINGTHHIKHLTFFNDGDAKNTPEKTVGNTGGIYHANVAGEDFEVVEKLAIKTMMNGGGGDCPENNLEAIIKGINACKNCEEVVLIADNFATPRDLQLVNKIERPVKVILCGTQGGINPKYLDFVRKNKGSLHIIEKDILDLMSLNEGNSIEINGVTYQIKNDRFFRTF